MPNLLKPVKKKNLKSRDSLPGSYERAIAEIQFQLYINGNKLPLRVGISNLSIKEESKLRLTYEDAGYEVEIVNYSRTTNVVLS